MRRAGTLLSFLACLVFLTSMVITLKESQDAEPEMLSAVIVGRPGARQAVYENKRRYRWIQVDAVLAILSFATGIAIAAFARAPADKASTGYQA